MAPVENKVPLARSGNDQVTIDKKDSNNCIKEQVSLASTKNQNLLLISPQDMYDKRMETYTTYADKTSSNIVDTTSPTNNQLILDADNNNPHDYVSSSSISTSSLSPMSDVNINSNENSKPIGDESMNKKSQQDDDGTLANESPVKISLPAPNSLALHTNLNNLSESQHVDNNLNVTCDGQKPIRAFVPSVESSPSNNNPNLIYHQQPHAAYLNQANYMPNYSNYNPNNQIPLNHPHHAPIQSMGIILQPPITPAPSSATTPSTIHIHVDVGHIFQVQLGDEIREIVGPATVRMISNDGSQPVPIQLTTPSPGQLVQQIVDENGVLTHLILSSQQQQQQQQQQAAYSNINMINSPINPGNDISGVMVSGDQKQPIQSGSNSQQQYQSPTTYYHPSQPKQQQQSSQLTLPPNPYIHQQQLQFHQHPQQHFQPQQQQHIIPSPTQSPKPLNVNTDEAIINQRKQIIGSNIVSVSPSSSSSCSSTSHTSSSKPSEKLKNSAKNLNNQTVFLNNKTGKQVNNGQKFQSQKEPKSFRKYMPVVANNNDTFYNNNNNYYSNNFKQLQPPLKSNSTKSTLNHQQSHQFKAQAQFINKANQLYDSNNFSQFNMEEMMLVNGNVNNKILIDQNGSQLEKPNNKNRLLSKQEQEKLNFELQKYLDVYQLILNSIKKPSVCDIESQSVLVRLSPIELADFIMKPDDSNISKSATDDVTNDNNNNNNNGVKVASLATSDYDEIIFKCENLNYTLELANETNMFNQVYTGDANEITLKDLKPNTKYFLRVFASLSPKCRGDFTDTVSFQTNTSEPDTPNPPKQMGAKKKNELTFRWTTPSENGSKLTNYILEYKEMTTVQSATDNILPKEFTVAYKGPLKQFILKKLSPSTCYGLRLAAENQIGISKFSKTILAFTLGCVPNVPAAPQLTEATISSMTLEWSESSDEVDFELQMHDMDDKVSASHGFLPVYNGPLCRYKVCDLKRCCNYQFRLRAKNEEGYSAWSETIKLTTKANIPNSPRKLRVKVHSIKNIRASWEGPGENGGEPVTSYTLELSSNSSLMDNEGFRVVYEGESQECLIEESLIPGAVYYVRVACSNLIGISESSQNVSFTTPSIKPAKIQPPKLHNKPKSNIIHIRWSYPDDDGGSAITAYELSFFEISNNNNQTPLEKIIYKGAEQSYVMNNLHPGRTYSIKLRASNENGSSEWSDDLEVTTAAGCPNAPETPVISVKSPNCLSVSWNEPLSNGSAITEYRLEWSMKKNEGYTTLYTGNALKFDIKGQMQPSNRYFVRIQANNINGPSVFSNSAEFIAPASAPSIVSNFKVDDTKSESILISWKQPNSNGMPITSYNLDFTELNASSPASYIAIHNKHQQCEYKIDSLVPDTQYKLRIQALNSVGAGQFSLMIKLRTKALAPAPPQLECISTSYNNIKLKWTNSIVNLPFTDSSSSASSNTNKLAALNDYQIVYNLEMMPEKVAGEKFTCIYKGPLSYFKANKLKESSKYLFRISALNETGQGKWSDIHRFKTAKSPPVITKSPVVSEITKNSCLIEWEPVELSSTQSSSTSDAEDLIKNSPDFLEYCLQVQSIKKDAEYRDIYKGQSTSFNLDDLDSGSDYNIRLCAVRVQSSSSSKRLCSSFTPHVTFSTLKCFKNSFRKNDLSNLPKKSGKLSFLNRFIWPSFYLNLNSSDKNHFQRESSHQQGSKFTKQKPYQSGKGSAKHHSSFESTQLTTTSSQLTSNRNVSDQQWALIFILIIVIIAFSIAFLANSLFTLYYESSTPSEL